MNIYLIGYMGSGKSTVGRQLARLLNYSHIDLDNLFEEAYRISIMDFYRKYDEEAFRIIERKLLQQTFSLKDHVISTGGGTACFFDNIELINSNGISVYIMMHEKSLFHRLKNSRRPRPLTANMNDEKLEKLIIEDMSRRRPFYNRARFRVKGEDLNPEELVNMLTPVINPS